MYKDLTKLAWTTLAMVTLVLVGVAAGILVEKGIRDGSDVRPGTPVLEAIRHVNKQIFIEHYLVVDVDYSDAPEGWFEWLEKLGIKQDFVVLIHGRVPAGFDLHELTEDHVWTSSDGKRVQLTLPAPMVFKDNVSIDFENCRVLAREDTCPNWICKDDLAAYQNEVLPAARDTLIEHAIRNGILEQTAQDGKVFYEQLLISLGFEQADVIVSGYGL